MLNTSIGEPSTASGTASAEDRADKCSHTCIVNGTFSAQTFVLNCHSTTTSSSCTTAELIVGRSRFAMSAISNERNLCSRNATNRSSPNFVIFRQSGRCWRELFIRSAQRSQGRAFMYNGVREMNNILSAGGSCRVWCCGKSGDFFPISSGSRRDPAIRDRRSATGRAAMGCGKR